MHVGRDNVNAALSSGKTFVTFAGTETFLYFIWGRELREFAAFEVLDDEEAWTRLGTELLMPIAKSCSDNGLGLLTDALVWRASPDYIARLGYKPADVQRFNEQAIAMVKQYVTDWRGESGVGNDASPAIINAELGPRGDGYKTTDIGVDAAREYHTAQIRALADTEVDMVTALTMTNVNEAVGMIQAAKAHGMPIGISPTVETDGSLPEGSMALGDFIDQVDQATDGYAAFFMVNCAHPDHLHSTLQAAKDEGASWLERLKGIRANASRMSHEELDNADTLDRGSPAEWAALVCEIGNAFDLPIVGGCCGTDAEHVQHLAKACKS
jgi:S-methylmethionine-dependent homocysteine/selenocysteine methylase